MPLPLQEGGLCSGVHLTKNMNRNLCHVLMQGMPAGLGAVQRGLASCARSSEKEPQRNPAQGE